MLLVNSAGGSADDPILAGLRAKFAFAAASMDAAEIVDVWHDLVSGFPGLVSVRSQLFPAPTIFYAGTTGSYNDTSKELSISSTAGLQSGNALYLSHPNITPNLYIIESIQGDGVVTLRNNPFSGLGNLSNIAFQIGWSYTVTIGAVGRNYIKVRIEDQNDLATQIEDSYFAAVAPFGADFISLNGGNYTGQVTKLRSFPLQILPAWAHKGGISHVELGPHSVQGANHFTWGDSTTTERTIASAELSGIKVDSTDGAKFGRLLLKTRSNGTSLGIDISLVVDTLGPTITLSAFGG